MKRPGKVFKGIVILAVLVMVFGMVTFAEDSTRFVPGTTINGISAGGLTVEEAKTKIEEFYTKEYRLSLVRKGKTKEYISGTELGCHAVVTGDLKAILDKQNADGRNSGPAANNSFPVQVNISYDEAALLAKIGALECIAGDYVTVTRNARISDYQEGQPFTIIPEVYGNSLDVDLVTAIVKEAVANGRTEIDLAETGCYHTVTVTAADEQMKNLCNTMNQLREMVITYTMGDAVEELQGKTICSWITGAESGVISVNRDMAAAYIKTLADKYDTANTMRTFQTASGREVSLTGPFGWKLDQAFETDALIAMIQTGQTQTREPQYTQSAVSRTLPDWGNTYVEIDMTAQHVYMIKDGAVAWDAPCVTGNIAKGHTTPEGIYSLNYKQRDKVLRGAKQADGSYEYESPVKYWMPFNGGIGLHDADWRSKFGGAIYQNSGSHGCINLPPDKTPALFDLVYAGIPVLCYN